MDLDQARDFFRRHHRAVLATRTGSGGIQQTPVVAGVDADGRLTVSSRETAYQAPMPRDRRVLIRVRPGRAGPDRSG